MNIFVTSKCPVECAQNLPNVLVNKMIIETLQMLSTAHIVLDGKQVAYKKTHQNHPSAVWVRETRNNYYWAFNHFVAMCNEYTHRTGKIHASSLHTEAVRFAPENCQPGMLTPFALCMPDEHKIKGVWDQTAAYKSYLNAKFSEWKARPKPIKLVWTNREMPSCLHLN